MVGDADAVEAALAVEINHLRHGKLAVGIIGVDVEIAQEHLRKWMRMREESGCCRHSTGNGDGNA